MIPLATPSPLEALFSSPDSTPAALAEALAQLERNFAKLYSSAAKSTSIPAVTQLVNNPSTSTRFITACFSGDYPKVAQVCLTCLPRSSSKPKRELILSTMLQALASASTPRAALALVTALSSFLSQSLISPSDIKSSFPALMSSLDSIFAPSPSQSELSATHVELAEAAAALLSPDELGTLCLITASSLVLADPASPSPLYFAWRFVLHANASLPAPELPSFSSTADSLASVDAATGLASLCLRLALPRPASLPLALAFCARALAHSALCRRLAPLAARREGDLTPLVRCFFALGQVPLPTFAEQLERAILPPHREFLLEFNEARDAAEPVHARLGKQHLLRLFPSILARFARLKQGLPLDEGDVVERSLCFDASLVCAGLLSSSSPADNDDKYKQSLQNLALSCHDPAFCPAIAACWARVIPPVPSSPPSVDEDRIVPSFVADPSRALFFVTAYFQRDDSLFYQACCESGEDWSDLAVPTPRPGWAGLWAARALCLTQLKSHVGLAPDTLALVEASLTQGETHFLPLVWHLERELVAYPSQCKEPKVQAFFHKNKLSIQLATGRLASLALQLELTRSLGTTAGLFRVATDSPASALAALDALVARRDAPACEALGGWLAAQLPLAGVRDFCDATALQAAGAHLQAASRHKAAVAALLQAPRDEAAPVLAAAANAALECLVRAGDVVAASTYLVKLSVLQIAALAHSETLGDALVPRLLTKAVLQALDGQRDEVPPSPPPSRLAGAVLVASLLARPSPETMARLSSLAAATTAGAPPIVAAGLQSLALAGEALVAQNKFLPLSTNAEADDFFFLHLVRRRLGFAPDVNLACKEATRAARAGDAATALAIVQHCKGHALPPRSAMALAQLLAQPGLAQHPADAELFTAQERPSVEPASAESWFAWAVKAGSPPDFRAAALERCLRLQPENKAACLWYLDALDALPQRAFAADLPLEALRFMAPHLFARARDDARIAEPLTRLVHESPASVMWALVSERPLPQVLLQARLTCPEELEGTLALRQCLLEAARTWDEDWDLLLDDPQPSPRQVHELLAQTLAGDLSEATAYNRAFAESAAGAACLTLSAGLSGDALAAARLAVRQFVQAQGSKRSLALVSHPARPFAPHVSVPGLHSVRLLRVSDEVVVLRTKTRPRRIQILDSSGTRRHFLLKSAEDLHLDERVVGLWASLGLPMRTYRVTPMGPQVGLIEWVERTTPLYHLYRRSSDQTVDELVQAEGFGQVLRDKQGDRLEAYRVMRSRVDDELLMRALVASSDGCETWWAKACAFATSCGTASGVGWALGLGDRHLDNILLDVDSGQCVHIDLNVCFDKGLGLRVPETVPFRLTPVVVRAFPFCALQAGHFASACARALEGLASKRTEVRVCLRAFEHDPVVSKSDAARRQRRERELAKELQAFEHEAERWLERVARLGSEQPVSEHEARTGLERARVQAARALHEAARDRDRVAAALALVLGGRCAALERGELARVDLSEKVGAAARERVLRAEDRVEQAERRLVEAAGRGELKAVCAWVQVHRPTLSSFGLEWGVALEAALRGATLSGAMAAANSAQTELDETRLEALKTQLAEAVEAAKASEDAWKKLPAPQTPTQLTAVSRMEKSLKRLREGLAVVDACLLLLRVRPGPLPAERDALDALERAQRRMELAREWTLLGQAPMPGENLLGLGGRALRRYCDGGEGLEAALDETRQLARAALDESKGEDWDRKAAAQATQRVLDRVDLVLQGGGETGSLVRRLIDDATSEVNLARMFEGWMAWV